MASQIHELHHLDDAVSNAARPVAVKHRDAARHLCQGLDFLEKRAVALNLPGFRSHGQVHGPHATLHPSTAHPAWPQLEICSQDPLSAERALAHTAGASFAANAVTARLEADAASSLPTDLALPFFLDFHHCPR